MNDDWCPGVRMHIYTLQVCLKEFLDEMIDADVVSARDAVKRDKATPGNDLRCSENSRFLRLLLEDHCRIEYRRGGNGPRERIHNRDRHVVFSVSSVCPSRLNG